MEAERASEPNGYVEINKSVAPQCRKSVFLRAMSAILKCAKDGRSPTPAEQASTGFD
jgi:hypothetical protein